MSKHRKRGQGINRVQRQSNGRARQQEEKEHQTEVSSPHPVLGSQSGEGNGSTTQQQPQQKRFWKNWDTIEKFTFWLVVFTAVYSSVSVWQGCAAREANQIARDALFSSDRPWLGVASLKLDPLQVGEDITVTALVQNFGKTPGMATTVRVRVPPPFAPQERVQAIQEAIAKFDESPVASEGVVFPGQLSRSVKDSLMYPMDEKGIKDFYDGVAQLLVIIRIRYRDQFGQPHHTQRCGVYNPKKDSFDGTTTEEHCDEAD